MGNKPEYRWNTAYEWLEWRYRTGSQESRIWLLLAKLDSDTIQDMFQDEMDEDGYFEDLNAPKEEDLVDCPACDGNDDDCDTCGGVGHVTQDEYDEYHNPTEHPEDFFNRTGLTEEDIAGPLGDR